MKNEMEHKKNIYYIFGILLFIVFSNSIYNSAKSFQYGKLCTEYRAELNRTTNENTELRRTIEECQSIAGSIGELCNRNISSSRGIIELTEELRAKVYELESSLGVFSQSEYYSLWDSYYGSEGLMN